MQQLENKIEPLWQVVFEVSKDQMYCYKGQKIDEVVMAIDEESAKETVLKMHQIDKENVILKGVIPWI